MISSKNQDLLQLNASENQVELNPTSDTQNTIIWLHGLGADGYDFVDLVPQLNFEKKPSTRFIFPHAPIRPISINNGYPLRAWYDVKQLNLQAEQDETGIRASEKLVVSLIETEIQRGTHPENILLIGFSQGGALALHTALRYPKQLAGVVVLSAYLPLHYSLAKEMSETNHSIPILMAHGAKDPIVSIQLGELSRDFLKELGYHVDWHVYSDMEHSVCADEVEMLGRWITGTIT